jgi:nitrate reductase gamma subunit
MTLLEFARGPGLQWSLAIFALGVLWRLVGSFLLARKRDRSKPAGTAYVKAGMRAMLMRSAPPHELEKNIQFQHYSGYAWHLGFFATLLLFGPHIPFFKQFLGFGWPALPNTVVLVIAGITLAILIALVVRRIVHPVMKQISSLDDWISVFMVILPFVTGFASYAHLQIGEIRYEHLLAAHILSVEAMLVWFPFSKLMHMFYAFPARFQVGVAMEHRGVKA